MSMLKVTQNLIGSIQAQDLAENSKSNLDLRYHYGVSASNVTVPEDVPAIVEVKLGKDEQKGPGVLADQLDETSQLTPKRLKAHLANIQKLIAMLNNDGTEWTVCKAVNLFAPVRIYVLISNGTKEVVYRSKNGMSNGTGVTEVVGPNGIMKNSVAITDPAEVLATKQRDLGFSRRMIAKWNKSSNEASDARVVRYYADLIGSERKRANDLLMWLRKAKAEGLPTNMVQSIL